MKTKRMTAALTALLLSLSLCACGKDNSVNKPDPAAAGKTETTAPADESSRNVSETEESKSTDSKSTAKSESKTTTKKSDASSKADPKASSKTDKADSKTDPDSSSDQNDASGNNSDNNSGGGNTVTEKKPDNNTPATSTAAQPADDDDDEENEEPKPTKYIQLNGTSAKYAGDGIFVDGGNITISKGGTYEISGTLSNGQIYVMTDKKKVKLHLNNASITNHAGSAINCQAAKKLTITSLPGTVNYLEDGGTHDDDKGAVFSEDTVVLNGEGVLNIRGNYAHGIQSDDDIRVNGGIINISATKSCLHSNDGIDINGGELFCDGGTNGIKTDGYINITGGSSIFLGGVREEKGAIYCDGSFTVTGGSFWAIGNTCTAPDASTTTANVIGMMFKQAQPEGSVVRVTSGANEIFAMTSPRSYKYVVYAGPNLLTNAEYSITYGATADTASENYVYYNANIADGTDGGSFTAGNTVTFYTVP